MVVVLGIIGGVIVPTLKYIKQIDSDTYNLRVSLERKNEQVTNYRMALKQVEKIKKEMPNFSEHVFSQGQELKLITTLETLAAAQGVTQKIVNSNLDKITNHRIVMSVAVNGSYNNVLSYLNAFEHLPYFISINRLRLTNSADRGKTRLDADSDLATMEFDLSLYVIP